MHPFGESDYQGTYRTSLNGPVYGLWSGKIGRDDFMEQFELAIEVGIRKAWLAGLEKAGIAKDEITQEDETALASFVLEQFDHVGGFADYIELHSKANGGKLASLQARLSLWANAYNKAVNAAMAAAAANPLLRWNRNPQKDSCADCIYADGRVYRKSVWLKWGWTPAAKNLACSGILCGCGWEVVPKGTRENKGHPRRPSGA